MAFIFKVEDGTGWPDATSNVSVSEANDIISVNIHADETWSQLTEDSKEKLLSWATRTLDERVEWEGVKTEASSSGSWPRTGVCDREGIEISEREIPLQLKVATAEMARYMMTEDRTATRPQDSLKELTVDVIELVFNEEYRLPVVPNNLIHLIHGLGYLRGGTGHNNFSKIRRSIG